MNSFGNLMKALRATQIGLNRPVYITNHYTINKGLHYMLNSYVEMNAGSLHRMRGWDNTEKVI